MLFLSAVFSILLSWQRSTPITHQTSALWPSFKVRSQIHEHANNPIIWCDIIKLDYLTSEEWPFVIKHIFTHQSGACNARNLALAQMTSEWFYNRKDHTAIICIYCYSINKIKNTIGYSIGLLIQSIQI